MNDALVLLAFQRPAIDWHGIAPELVLLAAGALITLVDIVFLEKARPFTAALAGLGLRLERGFEGLHTGLHPQPAVPRALLLGLRSG